MMFRTKAVALAAAAVVALPVLAACSDDGGKSATPSGTPTVIGPNQPAVANPPSDTSVDAGFARDMKEHHAQAVEMTFIIRDNTQNQQIRTVAYDIGTTQQHQIGQMYAWLDLWGLTQNATGRTMQWMSPQGMAAMGGHSMAPGQSMAPPGPDEPRMPGMATKAELEKLRSLKGTEAEIFFLQLMIKHHKAGVAMAQDALDHAQVEQVKHLARTMVNGQKAEMEMMTTFLADRGA